VFWTGLLAHAAKEHYEEIELVPSAGSDYAVRVRRLDSWQDLGVRGSAGFHSAMIQHLKQLAGFPPSRQISVQQGSFRYRTGQSEYQVQVTARVTTSGKEKFTLRMAAA